MAAFVMEGAGPWGPFFFSFGRAPGLPFMKFQKQHRICWSLQVYLARFKVCMSLKSEMLTVVCISLKELICDTYWCGSWNGDCGAQNTEYFILPITGNYIVNLHMKSTQKQKAHKDSNKSWSQYIQLSNVCLFQSLNGDCGIPLSNSRLGFQTKWLNSNGWNVF